MLPRPDQQKVQLKLQPIGALRNVQREARKQTRSSESDEEGEAASRILKDGELKGNVAHCLFA